MLSENKRLRSQENIVALKQYLSKDLNLELEPMPGFQDVYQLSSGTTVAIQYSKYHPNQYHYWFGIARSKLEKLQGERTFFLLICEKSNQVYVLPSIYLKQLLNQVPTVKSGDKWEFNILDGHRLRLYGKKDVKYSIFHYLNKFDCLFSA